ncbi:MAG: protein-PII uridylyltransferase, partial [Pseudomonadota bacterium]
SIALAENSEDHILEVVAGDRPGLLANIAQILHAHKINLRSARINTLGERAEDIFVVSGSSLKQEKERVALETELAKALR